MKRIFILVVVTLFAVGSIFADERTLIDFSLLGANVALPERDKNPDGSDAEAPEENNHNYQTLMDFSNNATNNFTARQKLTMRSSLAIANWDVIFSSSSRNVTTKHLSYTKEATSKGAFGEEKVVMGVRIHFPTESFNSWAAVKPPFAIPAFEGTTTSDDGTINEAEPGAGTITPSRFEGPADDEGKLDKEQPAFGIIKNVGTIKSIAVNVYGLNFPHSLSVILIDDKGVEKTYFMGYLNFEGWGELRWDNPAYVQNVRNRELRVDPIYPDSTPYVKFGGFVVQKQASMKGGDFVAYFRDVKIIYDQAVLEVNRDINDEATWEIIKDRDTSRNTSELQRVGQAQMQRALDLDRQATQSTFKPTDPQE